MKLKRFLVAIVAIGLLGIVMACSTNSTPSAGQAQQSDQAIVGQYQAALTAAEPYPLAQMKDSTERANLIEKLLRFNDPNKIGYVYELTSTGQIWSFYTIKGKVSSTDSQLTATNTISDAPHGTSATVASPGDDGSYGPNEPGIFFFTTEGVMVEWNGLYQYTDAPLRLTAQPIAIYDPNSTPSSTAGKPVTVTPAPTVGP
jgi:hypothetical protein